MMRFAKVPRPRGWQTHVLKAGVKWLKVPANQTKGSPRKYWLKYADKLAAGFHELCGYTVMWTPNGDADHFTPWAHLKVTKQLRMAYEWSNFRYADHWFNISRKTTPIPDPFEVDDNWFDLLLPSLELVATSSVPLSEVTKVTAALRWLGKSRGVLKKRRGFWKGYRTLDANGNPGISFTQLEEWAPLIARALRKNPHFLHPADFARHQAGTL